MPARMMNNEEAAPILEMMGYIDPETCCGTCWHYTPTDCGGSHNALDEHCNLNPAFKLPVKERGRCDHHRPKKKD